MTTQKHHREGTLQVVRAGDRILAAVEETPGEILGYRLGTLKLADDLTPSFEWTADIPDDVLEAVDAMGVARAEETAT